MLTSIGLIVLGLAALVVGGEVLLRGAVGVATLARLTPAVIGLTVVAAGTSVPELAVSFAAGVRGQTDITVGNVVGSNVFNLAFVLGLAAVVRPLAIAGNTIRLEYPVLVLVTLLCVATCDRGRVARLDGVLFLCVYAAFTAYLVSLVRGQVTAGEAEAFAGEVWELTPGGRPGLGRCLGLLAGGVLLLWLGAEWTVGGASDLGRRLGMSERVIGLTIVGIGTGLPEAVTAVVASYRGRDDVAVGNVIGSNLFNILCILGLTAVVRPLPIAEETRNWDNWWMLGVTLLLFPLMLRGRRLVRWEGAVLLAAYAAYLASLAR